MLSEAGRVQTPTRKRVPSPYQGTLLRLVSVFPDKGRWPSRPDGFEAPFGGWGNLKLQKSWLSEEVSFSVIREIYYSVAIWISPHLLLAFVTTSKITSIFGSMALRIVPSLSVASTSFWWFWNTNLTSQLLIAFCTSLHLGSTSGQITAQVFSRHLLVYGQFDCIRYSMGVSHSESSMQDCSDVSATL